MSFVREFVKGALITLVPIAYLLVGLGYAAGDRCGSLYGILIWPVGMFVQIGEAMSSGHWHEICHK